MLTEEKGELFTDVIGQDFATSVLSKTLQTQRIAPAYLFSGSEGIGRRLTTLRFLEGIISGGHSCLLTRKRIEGLNHPDLIWIEPTYLNQGKLIPQSIASKTVINRRVKPQIRLKQIKQVKSFLANQPIEASLNMTVIEGAENMNEASSNALLKTLEEPRNGLLILISARPESLLATIRSRCQLIPFKKIKSNDINKILSKIQSTQNIDLSIGLHEQELLKLANGSPGGLIENINTWQELPQELLSRMKKPPKEAIDALSLARDLTETVDDEQQIWLIKWLQISLWGESHDSKAIKVLDNLHSQLKSFVQPRLAWEVALLKLTETKA